jgi:CO/xanthine dehydrogenase Mo-binding subunit
MADRFSHVRRHLRREDDRLLRGLDRFAADLVPGDAVRLVLLRSPHAHARISTSRLAGNAAQLKHDDQRPTAPVRIIDAGLSR